MLARLNARLAKQAYDYTIRLGLRSTNHLSLSEKMTAEGQDIISRMDVMRAIPIPYQEFSLPWILRVAELAKEYGVGNCCEKACVAFAWMYYHAPKGTPIELFNNPFQDHCFAVVGRCSDTKSYDLKSWNADAGVSDPWAKGYYLVGQVKRREFANTVWGNVYLRDKETKSYHCLTNDVVSASIHQTNTVISAQHLIVLRQRAISGTLAFSPAINSHVPIVFESWDRPTEKHFRRHVVDKAIKEKIKKSLLDYTVFKTTVVDKVKIADVVMDYVAIKK